MVYSRPRFYSTNSLLDDSLKRQSRSFSKLNAIPDGSSETDSDDQKLNDNTKSNSKRSILSSFGSNRTKLNSSLSSPVVKLPQREKGEPNVQSKNTGAQSQSNINNKSATLSQVLQNMQRMKTEIDYLRQRVYDLEIMNKMNQNNINMNRNNIGVGQYSQQQQQKNNGRDSICHLSMLN
eukprot:UN07059